MWPPTGPTRRLLAVFCVLLGTACSGGSAPEVATPPPAERTEVVSMVWPEIDSIEPAPAAAGTIVRIEGHGGYLMRDAEGSTAYDESYRVFKLYFDDEEIGELGCYVNRCEGEFAIPSGTAPGVHTVSTDGGATVQIEIVAD